MGNSTISVWLQSAVGGPEPLQMASLRHMKTQLRELRYFSGVTQSLCQLREWGQRVHQMGDGILTQPVLNAMVRLILFSMQIIGILMYPVTVTGGLVAIKHWTVKWIGFSPTCKDLSFFRMHLALPQKLSINFPFTSFGWDIKPSVCGVFNIGLWGFS